MTAVWVVRDKDGHFQYAYPNMMEALDAADFADTVTRETLLTPAHAAVIEAAVEWHSVEFRAYHMQVMQDADEKLYAAVATLRELEGE